MKWQFWRLRRRSKLHEFDGFSESYVFGFDLEWEQVNSSVRNLASDHIDGEISVITSVSNATYGTSHYVTMLVEVGDFKREIVVRISDHAQTGRWAQYHATDYKFELTSSDQLKDLKAWAIKVLQGKI